MWELGSLFTVAASLTLVSNLSNPDHKWHWCHRFVDTIEAFITLSFYIFETVLLTVASSITADALLNSCKTKTRSKCTNWTWMRDLCILGTVVSQWTNVWLFGLLRTEEARWTGTALALIFSSQGRSEESIWTDLGLWIGSVIGAEVALWTLVWIEV